MERFMGASFVTGGRLRHLQSGQAGEDRLQSVITVRKYGSQVTVHAVHKVCVFLSVLHPAHAGNLLVIDRNTLRVDDEEMARLQLVPIDGLHVSDRSLRVGRCGCDCE